MSERKTVVSEAGAYAPVPKIYAHADDAQDRNLGFHRIDETLARQGEYGLRDVVSDATRDHERGMGLPMARPAWSWRRICEVRIAVAHSQVGFADHPWIGAVY